MPQGYPGQSAGLSTIEEYVWIAVLSSVYLYAPNPVHSHKLPVGNPGRLFGFKR